MADANIKAVAFFGDCKHKITPVQKGVRITVSYVLNGRRIEGVTKTLAKLGVEASDPAAAAAADAAAADAAAAGAAAAGAAAAGADANDESAEPPAATAADAAADAAAADIDVAKAEATADKKAKENQASEQKRLAKLKVPQLKEECRSRGLKVSGNKDQLIARLIAGDSGDGGVVEAAPLRYLPTKLALEKARYFARAFLRAMCNKALLPKGGRLGFACEHLYEQDAQLPTDVVAPNAACADLRMKGTDAIITVTMARLGFKGEREKR